MKRIWIEMFTSIKHHLLQKFFGKFKELTTMRHSHQ
jgi:hypothetical protein